MVSSDVNRKARDARWRSGFTLVELMVVVAVIAIIAAIAYPAYTDFVERSRRSEATEALQDLATLQEQYYNENKEYFPGPNPGALGMPGTTANDYYNLTITAGAAVDGTIQSYTLSASPQGPQASDTDCANIQLDSDGNKTPEDCW